MTRAEVMRRVHDWWNTTQRSTTNQDALALAYDLGRAEGLREGRHRFWNTTSLEAADEVKGIEARVSKRLRAGGGE